MPLFEPAFLYLPPDISVRAQELHMSQTFLQGISSEPVPYWKVEVDLPAGMTPRPAVWVRDSDPQTFSLPFIQNADDEVMRRIVRHSPWLLGGKEYFFLMVKMVDKTLPVTAPWPRGKVSLSCLPKPFKLEYLHLPLPLDRFAEITDVKPLP